MDHRASCPYPIDSHQRQPRTPTRKSDQWQRLAEAVRSSPQRSGNKELMWPAKVDYGLMSRGNGDKSYSNVRKSIGSSSFPVGDFDSSPSKIRPLSRGRSLPHGVSGDCWRSSQNSLSLAPISSHPEDINATFGQKPLRSSMRDLSCGVPEYYGSNRKRKSCDGINHDGKRIAKSKKSSKSKKVTSASMSDPYSWKYLSSFGALLIVTMVALLLSNKVYWNSLNSEHVKTKLIIEDLNMLEKNFKEKIFGQHIARQVIINVLTKFVHGDQVTVLEQIESGAEMAVLSLHGWTGVGKTFLTQLVVDSLNPEKFIRFIIPIHFPHSIDNTIYKDVIEKTILSNISRSAVSVVIFDEIDKASPGVLQAITASLLRIKGDNSFRNATVIVLFVSNSLGQTLNNHLFVLLSQGRLREELQASDFDELFPLSWRGQEVRDHWFNVLAEHQLIDAFVPFLPLDLSHIKQCVMYDMLEKGLGPSDALVERVCAELSFFVPPGLDVPFSQTGCKRVSEKVDLHSDQVL